jgi:ferric-dicitrate binding protein FerR (iron transport regulator)
MNTKKSIKSKIIAHLNDELDTLELEELYKWIYRSEENARYYVKIKDLWEASIIHDSEIADTKNEWNRFVNIISIRNKNRKGYFLNSWYKIAVVLVFGLFIGGAIVKFVSVPEKVYFTAFAPKGSISQVLLSDSTFIYLNAGTELKYNFTNGKREVYLNGEAWFNVKKMKAKPFIVHTNYYDVKVLGTKFNVKTYYTDRTVETTLEEGSVTVLPTKKFRMKRVAKLVPNQQLVFDKINNTLKVREVNPKQYTSWKENKLIFINMNLGELIIVLERKYGVDIEVKDKSILEYHYDGTIKNETIFELLDIIKKTLPIDYILNGQKIEIITK